jgi:hypothetical protein
VGLFAENVGPFCRDTSVEVGGDEEHGDLGVEGGVWGRGVGPCEAAELRESGMLVEFLG